MAERLPANLTVPQQQGMAQGFLQGRFALQLEGRRLGTALRCDRAGPLKAFDLETGEVGQQAVCKFRGDWHRLLRHGGEDLVADPGQPVRKGLRVSQ